jgi:hypothetical protein
MMGVKKRRILRRFQKYILQTFATKKNLPQPDSCPDSNVNSPYNVYSFETADFYMEKGFANLSLGLILYSYSKHLPV